MPATATKTNLLAFACLLAIALAFPGLPAQARSEQQQQPLQVASPLVSVEAAVPVMPAPSPTAAKDKEIAMPLVFTNFTSATFVLQDYRIVILPAEQRITDGSDLLDPEIPDRIGPDNRLRPILVFAEKPNQITTEDQLDDLTRLSRGRRGFSQGQALAAKGNVTQQVRLSSELLDPARYEPVAIYVLCGGRIVASFAGKAPPPITPSPSPAPAPAAPPPAS